jgi:hypothetical protein
MSAGQQLLLRRSLTERFVPLVSARVPQFGPMAGCLAGRDPCWATLVANLPHHVSGTTSNCGRGGHKNPDANAHFLPDLTIFRMNTCAKRVGGGGRFSTPTLTPRGRPEAWRMDGVQLHPQRDLRYSAAQGSGDNF